ncbi:ABC transporter substrate-binding protein [Microbacterium caowuchunii]|uniref:Carbohydrate ABC transporter substrate-binding protein n=1 Tax=Microbacterium caowuchunii TaxID=2614638 RepID=A0A5N0TB27_9MICO|nr:ABC transporter substrate-binding protein [Microbacterium caowuchunii]KAA9132273.1 carbohydrate ABC transporter substrate-binding protein [Microbacterium caowuchunii]
MEFSKPRRLALGASGLVAALALAGCSAGGGANDGSELSVYIDSNPSSIALWDALVAGYAEVNPDVTIKVETHPAGGEGDNLIKTRLSTGDMNDMFWYNSGSTLKALNPDKTLVSFVDEEWVGSLDENFIQAVSTEDGLYGAPVGASNAGAMTYNKDIYAELGLEVPTTWDEFMANAQAVTDAGLVGIIQTYGDAWTSQVPVLGDFYNVTAADPEWADQYTAGVAKFADEPALAGFQHLQDAFDAGVLNRDYASATYDDGVRMLAEGEGAHYPMLTQNVAEALGANFADEESSIGVFPIPGDDAASNGLTVWMPNGVYVPQTTEGAKLDAVKEFLAWLVTPESCAIQGSATTLGGPFIVDGCDLPDNAAALVGDMQSYFDEGKTSVALEFLSAIKGPSLEQITVEVGSGIRSAADGAALYDQDVIKQAKQLGLDW